MSGIGWAENLFLLPDSTVKRNPVGLMRRRKCCKYAVGQAKAVEAGIELKIMNLKHKSKREGRWKTQRQNR